MRLELAERLRCPNDHVPTPMIVVAIESRDREMLRGFAGCPVCRLEAKFEDGDLHFPMDAASDVILAQAADLTPRPTINADGSLGPPPSPSWAPEFDRTRALLSLDEPGGSVLLNSRYAAFAPLLAESLDMSVVIMGSGWHDGPAHCAARIYGPTRRVPFIDGTFRAATIEFGLDDDQCADLVRTLALGGRMLGSVMHAVPPGLTELARDDHEWVAARETSGAVVELKRSRQPSSLS